MIVMIIQVVINPIIIGLVVFRVAWSQCKGLDVFMLHMHECRVVEVAAMTIEGNYLTFDREAPHTLENLIVALSHPSLCIYPDGM